MAFFGDISYGLAIGAGKSVQRNAGDTAFEAVYSNPNYWKYNISVTVDGSGNLTVALKNYLGTDPSTATPVIVQIGDTVHVITSALSKTINAGANYFNAGSAELATQAIDFFAYLYYDTAVGFGFGRLPNAKVKEDWVDATASEKLFSAFLGGSVGAGAKMVNIGRFTATLSAGAGYTWSISGNGNVINRPIYETDLLVYNPTPYGSVTPLSIGNGLLIGYYRIKGTEVTTTIAIVFGTTSTAGDGIWAFSGPFSIPGFKNTTVISGGGYAFNGNTYSLVAHKNYTYAPDNTIQLSTYNNRLSHNQPFVWSNGYYANFTVKYDLVSY